MMVPPPPLRYRVSKRCAAAPAERLPPAPLPLLRSCVIRLNDNENAVATEDRNCCCFSILRWFCLDRTATGVCTCVRGLIWAEFQGNSGYATLTSTLLLSLKALKSRIF